ncbi:MAG: hypothetical protein MUC56_00030 [Thermoanaerobaculales bacterium]|jgi:hypothetical protein|nr:hypothetical protein [Thermoanaerobaculales bacterium]
MTRTSTALLTAATSIALALPATPAGADGWVGVGVSSQGIGLSFGVSSGWDPWGPAWYDPSWSFGFTTTLDGYGEWVRVDGLGRVWRPWVVAGWQPYSYGRWVWTSLGWTWVAYEPWGWLPHHYGNWAYTRVGWVWAPGTIYHPGNVVWMSSGGYLGWAPCAPVGWSHAHRGYHRGWHDGYGAGYADGWADARYATWVPRSHVVDESIARHTVGYEVVAASTSRIGVTRLDRAPARSEVERMAGRQIPETRISERRATVEGREVRLVRPEGLTDSVRRHAAATARTVTASASRSRAAAPAAPAVAREAPPSVERRTTRSRTVSEPGSPPARSRIEATPTVSSRQPARREPSTTAAAEPRARTTTPARGTAPARTQPAPARSATSVEPKTTGAAAEPTDTGRRPARRENASGSASARRSPDQPERSGSAKRTPPAKRNG